jgi:YjbE family integral membrane protein
MLLGAGGSVVLMVLLTGLTSLLIMQPLLRIAGGAALLWIAIKMLIPEEDNSRDGHGKYSTFSAIRTIVVAKALMSIDNVLGVAAAAHGDMLLVIFGIGLSLPLVVWGSGVLARMMVRFPWIVWLGGGILGYVAGEMILRDRLVAERLGETANALHYPVPLALGLGLTALGWWFARAHGRAARAR